MRPTVSRRGFTLIELLVVVAILAILIGILLPALGRARAEARAVQTGSNVRQVGQGVTMYTTANEIFPPSYVYASSRAGSGWRIEDQKESNPNPGNGYIHWSYALFSGGSTAPESFTSAAVTNGGAPRTNPGPNDEHWEDWQRNDLGQGSGAEEPEDRQVPRCAFTGNAALFPRNKLTDIGTQRQNRLVNPARVQGPARTILATEFYDFGGWRSLKGGGLVCKSHRPISPFISPGQGTDIYNVPDSGTRPRFFYPKDRQLKEERLLGEGLIEDSETQLNCVGRHQPGGTANFVFADGHVERTEVIDTIRRRLWGDKFYSLTGSNIKIELREEAYR